MVDVLEELELDRFAEPLGRLESVEDDAAAAAGEMLVEETDGAAEDPRQVALPFVPLLVLEVPARDATPAAIDRVEVIADRPGEIPGVVEVGRASSADTHSGPSRKAATRTRRDSGNRRDWSGRRGSLASLRRPAPLRPAQAELRLADARRPGHDRQRARKQSTSQGTVQVLQSKRMSSNGHSSLAYSAAAGGRIRKSSRTHPFGASHFRAATRARARLSSPAMKLRRRNAELCHRIRTIRRSLEFVTGPVRTGSIRIRREADRGGLLVSSGSVRGVLGISAGASGSVGGAAPLQSERIDQGRSSVDSRSAIDQCRVMAACPDRLRLVRGRVVAASACCRSGLFRSGHASGLGAPPVANPV